MKKINKYLENFYSKDLFKMNLKYYLVRSASAAALILAETVAKEER